MTRRHWAHSIVAAVVVAACAAAAPAAASEPTTSAVAGSGTAGTPEAAATAYLQARANAIASAAPAAALADWVQTGSALARTEAQVAAGMALRGQKLGRTAQSATCRVTLLESSMSDDGMGASVRAHVITTVTWRSRGGSDAEANGVDHRLTLVRDGGRWLVAADAYADSTRAACLEAAGASKAKVRAAARATERSSSPLRLPAAAPRKAAMRRYVAAIRYDRDAVRAYADKYALTYNPTFVDFNADCANFGSQCGRAGGMPLASGSYTTGWWYDKNGTSSPRDDTYSLSWINVAKQMGFWNLRRTYYKSSVSDLSRGDFIYYDWSGDGVWDHVAVVVGVNSSGQKIVDAHTTDRYHAFWKLGSSSTKYKFAGARDTWII